jgi:hypothetical protein
VHACNINTRRPRQEDSEFEASLGYVVRFCCKKIRRKRIKCREIGVIVFKNVYYIKSLVGWYMSVILATWEVQIESWSRLARA